MRAWCSGSEVRRILGQAACAAGGSSRSARARQHSSGRLQHVQALAYDALSRARKYYSSKRYVSEDIVKGLFDELNVKPDRSQMHVARDAGSGSRREGSASTPGALDSLAPVEIG